MIKNYLVLKQSYQKIYNNHQDIDFILNNHEFVRSLTNDSTDRLIPGSDEFNEYLENIAEGLKFAYARANTDSSSQANGETSDSNVVTDESKSLEDLMSQLEDLGN